MQKKALIAAVLLLAIVAGLWFWKSNIDKNAPGALETSTPEAETEYAPFAGSITPSDPITDPSTALVHSYVTGSFRPIAIIPNPFPKTKTEHLVILTDRDPSKPSCEFTAAPTEYKICYYFFVDTPQATYGYNDPYMKYPRFITSWVSGEDIIPHRNTYHPDMLSKIFFENETAVVFTASFGDDVNCRTKSAWRLDTLTGEIIELNREKITSGCSMYN